MIGIYRITSPTKKVYIGQSVNIERRFYEYSKLKNCNTQPKLYNSFKKYGVENHIFEIIEESSIELLNYKERYYQDLFNVIGRYGLNCVLQDTSFSKRIVSDETKLKLKKARKNQIKTKETLTKMSISMMGKNKGVNNGMFGKKIKDSVKSIQRLKLSGELNYLSKIILNKETGVFYFGLKEASDSINMKKQTLHVNITRNKKNKTNFIYV